MKTFTLNKQSSEQLYLQIRRMLLIAIQDRVLNPGERIPSVVELAKSCEVSRMTVRQALQALIDEGWIFTVPGKGTFVAKGPHVEQNLQKLMGWTEEISAQGLRPSTRFVSLETVPADSLIAGYLQVLKSSPVYRLTRVRLADDFPVAVEKCHLVCSAYPDFNLYWKQNPSLYAVMRDIYRLIPVRAVQFLDAGELDPESAGLLEIPPGKPALIAERISYSAEHIPLEYTRAVTRAGFLRYKTEMNTGSSSHPMIVTSDERD